MDFFARQDRARRNTSALVVYFALAILGLTVAVYVAVLVIVVGVDAKSHGAFGVRAGPWNPELFLAVAAVTLAVIWCGSAFKFRQLSQGGSAVATMLGGRLVGSDSTDPDERKLLNVVEEMAVASGVPVPQVYVMDGEPGINAFAAGHTPSDAAVGATRGCVKLLTRDELQGVIAHEFGHILNGDMRLNLRLIGLIFGIVCLTVIGRILLRTRGRKNPMPMLGLALILIGWIGVLFGRLIQAAVSRQRELLADASAAQFTRNPLGLAGALKKIGGLAQGSRLESVHAEEASHLFFANGLRKSFFGLMATHPTLEERILALDPAFDGTFPHVSFEAARDEEPAPRKPARALPGFPLPYGVPVGMVPAGLAARDVLPSLGSPTHEHLRYAVEFRDSIPPALESAVRDPLGATALIYALLLSDDPAVREQQLGELAGSSDAVRQETLRIWPEARNAASRSKLPLVDLALPALRNLSPAQFQELRAVLWRLVESDNRIDLFEFMLKKIVVRHLSPHFELARKPVVQFYALGPLLADCGVLLSAIASVGHEDAADARGAFDQGARILSGAAPAQVPFLHEAQCDLARVDRALDRLDQAAPGIKRSVILACAQTVAADGVIQEPEAELLRSIADALDSPIPPFVRPPNRP